MTNNPQQSIDKILKRIFEDGANAYYRHSSEHASYDKKKKLDVEEAKAALKEVVDGIIGENLVPSKDQLSKATAAHKFAIKKVNDYKDVQRKRAAEAFGLEG